MFVKICGLTSVDAVQAAVAAGADALGFVFAPSPRELTPDKAIELAADVPRHILRVAVLHHPTRAHFERVISAFAPDWVQCDTEDFAGLPQTTAVVTLPVLRSGQAHASPLPQRILFEGPRSGSGTTADWDEARALAARTQLILAGGLRADNVAAAIAGVRPWGVDVSSGVERAPGRKEPDKINEFVARVRALET
jgi:phosphoribosylanthranilate isomerase